MQEYVHRHRGNVAAHSCSGGNVNGVADRCGDNFGIYCGSVEDVDYFLDKVQALHTYVVKSAQEGAYKGCARSCGKKRLCGGKYQGNIGLYALCGKLLAGLQALLAHRELDNDVLVDCGKGKGFLYHFIRFKGNNLGGDRAVYDLGDLGNYLLKVTSFLGDKGMSATLAVSINSFIFFSLVP